MRLLGTALVEDMELVIACGASKKPIAIEFKN
jgi:hypothetical protein